MQRSGGHLLRARDRSRHQHSVGSRGRGGAHVGADVADHGQGVNGQSQRLGGVQHHPGRGLAARAAVIGAVRAEHPDVETAEQLIDTAVHSFGLRAVEKAARDARLVRDDSQRKSRLPRPLHRIERGRHRRDP